MFEVCLNFLSAFGHSTAEKYDIDALRKQLWNKSLLGRGDGMDAMNVMGEAIWIPKYPIDEPGTSSSSNAGEIFIFENGSYVTWHMSQEDAKSFAEDVLQTSNGYLRDGINAIIEIQKYKETQTEAMDFMVRSGEITGVKDDLIVIGTSDVESSGDVMGSALGSEATRRTSNSSQSPVATTIEPLPGTHSAKPTVPSSDAFPPPLDDVPDELNSGRINLPRTEADLRARLSLSSGLARSTKLAVYEEMLEDLMDECVHSAPPLPSKVY